MQPIDSDDSEAGFFRRHRIKLTVAALAVVGVGLLATFGVGPEKPERPAPAPHIVTITVPPPPPPPPPPKPREPRPEPPSEQQQMIAQEAVTEPDPAPPAEAAPSDAPLGTGIKGDGAPDGFGLGTSGGGGGFFGGRTGGGSGSGGRWGWYASQVQTVVQSALGAHPRTKSLSLDARVRIWVDANGRVERVEIARDSLAPELVDALREALVGVQLRQAAPADMPMPIVMRVNARRPS